MAFIIRESSQEKVNLADKVFESLSSENYDFFSNLEQALNAKKIEYTDQELAHTINKLIRKGRVFIPSVKIKKEKKKRTLVVQRISRKLRP